MKKLTIIITLVILLISLYGIFFYTGVVIIKCSTVDLLRLLLCFLGIVSFILYLFKSRVFVWLNIIWFLPQIMVVTERTFNYAQRTYFDNAVYNMTIIFNFGFMMLWETNSNTCLVLNANIFAIVGLFLSLVIAERSINNGKIFFAEQTAKKQA